MMVGPNNLGDDSVPVAPRKRRGKDYLKPGTEAFYKRQARHKHNGFQGTVKMAVTGMEAIVNASTATPRAKSLARQAQDLLWELGKELKIRVD
jgi:hypothetical protein